MPDIAPELRTVPFDAVGSADLLKAERSTHHEEGRKFPRMRPHLRSCAILSGRSREVAVFSHFVADHRSFDHGPQVGEAFDEQTLAHLGRAP